MKLGITSIGMVSPVGLDVVTACASIRAGISRPAEIAYYQVFEPGTQSMTSVIGYPVADFNEGFHIVGAWTRLAIQSLGDLIRYGNLPKSSNSQFWSATGLIVTSGLLNDGRFGDEQDEQDDPATPETLLNAFVIPLLEAFGLPIPVQNANVVCQGHAGALIAVDVAREMINSGSVKRVIVLGVDSYLDPLTLDWLAENDRLKDDEHPTGVMPGEAAAAFLIEDASSRRPFCCEIKGAAHAREPQAEAEAEQPSQGIALSHAMAAVLEQAGIEGPFDGDIINDFNGEYWRAYEAGSARVRLGGRLAEDAKYHHPAEACGDTGAASGAVSVCVATRSLQRGYASGNTVLVTASADDGNASAICLSTGGDGEHSRS